MSPLARRVATCGTSPTGVSSQPVTKGQRRYPGRSPACGLSWEEDGQQLAVGPVGTGGGQQLAVAAAGDGGLLEGVSGWSGAAPGGAFGGQQGGGDEVATRSDLILISFKTAPRGTGLARN